MRTTVFACAIVCLTSAQALAQEAVPAASPPDPPAAEAPATRWVPDSDPVSVTVAPAAPERDTTEAKPQRSFHLDVGAGTDVPVFVGGYVGAELPGRLLLQVGVGVMPAAYSGAINTVLQSTGAYDATIGGLVQKALGNPLVFRASAGWRPFTNHGLEILGGYTLIQMNGSETEGDIINAVLMEAGASERVPAGSGVTIPLSATLHNIHATLGWRWLLADDHLVIRASLSYLQCLGANVGVSLPGVGQAMEATVNQQLNAFVSPYFTSYVKTPLVGLSAAYRF